MIRTLRIFVAVLASFIGAVVGLIQFQRACEPLTVGQCVDDWIAWLKSAETPDAIKEATKRAADRKAAEEERKRAIQAQKDADAAAAAAKEAQEKADAEAAERERKTEAKRQKDKAAADEQARRDADQRRRDEAEQAERDRIAHEEADRRARDDQARRAAAERQQQAQARRQEYLERARCGDPGNGEYICCPLGQMPDERLGPGQMDGYKAYCRPVDVR